MSIWLTDMKHNPSETPQLASEASAIALNFLAFLASDQPRLERFLALTGMTGHDLRRHIESPVFHGHLLDYALSDESLLLAFAAAMDLAPEAIGRMRRHLPGAAPA